MGRSITRASAVIGALATLTAAGAARAYEDDAGHLQLVGEIGVLDRGTTGIGGPLLGHGYDANTVPAGTLGLRYYDSLWYGRGGHGFDVRVSKLGGATFGLGDHAFDIWMLDVGYTMRVEFSCMRSEAARWYLSGTFGVSGYDATAGDGVDDGGEPLPKGWSEGRSSLDHVAVGWVLNLNLDAHLGAFMVGAGVQLRQHFGATDGPVQRSFMLAATLRLGVDLGL